LLKPFLWNDYFSIQDTFRLCFSLTINRNRKSSGPLCLFGDESEMKIVKKRKSNSSHFIEAKNFAISAQLGIAWVLCSGMSYCSRSKTSFESPVASSDYATGFVPAIHFPYLGQQAFIITGLCLLGSTVLTKFQTSQLHSKIHGLQFMQCSWLCPNLRTGGRLCVHANAFVPYLLQVLRDPRLSPL
jgi:hypothetical protein